MKNKNLFHASRQTSVVHKIAFTGLFLSLVILLQYLERFMPLGFGFIKINLSLLFILPIFYFSGPIYGIFVLIFRFVIGVTISGGFNELTMTSHFILLVCSSITIIIMYIFSSLFNKVKNHHFKVSLILISTLIVSSLIATFLNQVLFTPMYFALPAMSNNESYHFSLSETIKTYQNIKFAYFDINNYWLGTFAAYFAGNLIKLTIIFIIYFPLSNVLRQHAKNHTEIWK